MSGAQDDLWIFAYGSLIWRPDFVFVEAHNALLRGWHRSMCILSTHYRGTEEQPGLVLGLDRGGACWGRAFRVAAPLAGQVQAMLHAREMITGCYQPRHLPVTLADGRRLHALGYTALRNHPQYVGGMADADMAARIGRACGSVGPCRDYLANTVEHLSALGIRDRRLERLLILVDQQPSS